MRPARSSHRRALLALVAAALPAPAARAADADLGPYYPKGSFAVLTVDLKRIAASPFAKKVFGADEPFTAARKLALLLANPIPAQSRPAPWPAGRPGDG